MMPKYDVIIKSHNKDYVKLPYVVDSIRYLIPQPEHIYLINPDGYIPEECALDKRIIGVMDGEVFPMCDKKRFLFRPSWCMSSTMAVFQNITEEDFYLDIQSDSFFVNPLELFTKDNKPIFFISPQHKHYHQPYYTFIEKMIGLSSKAGVELGIEREDSFIMDFMMYHKPTSREILEPHGGIINWFNKSVEITNMKCHISDQDLFANWVVSRHPDMYHVQKGAYVRVDGKNAPETFTKEEIEFAIESAKNTPMAVAASCHTWHPWEHME